MKTTSFGVADMRHATTGSDTFHGEVKTRHSQISGDAQLVAHVTKDWFD